MDKPKPKVTTQKRQTALASVDFVCATSRLITGVIGDVSKWIFFHQALQNPAKRNNPDSRIDYRFPERDDNEISPVVTKGQETASGGIGVIS
jgi:hypothetical protein